jgi:hypothetical protein
MRSISSPRVLRLLFLLPYISIAATGFALITANTLFIAKLLGCLHLLLLIGYLVSILENHTAKSSLTFLNAGYTIWSIVAVPLLGVSVSDLGVPLILHLFWLPRLVRLLAVVAIPSVSVIVPGSLILGNGMAASSESILMDYGVTHIVGIREGDSMGSLSSSVAVENVFHLRWSADDVGTKLRETVDFINLAFKERNDAVVLVYCPSAVCLSPLVVVYWLVSTGRVSGVQAGYRLIRKARPVVEIDRNYMQALENVKELKDD